MFKLPRAEPPSVPAVQPHLLHQHIQELESRLTEYRRRVSQDLAERDAWQEVVRRAAALFAGPELDLQLRAQADWMQHATPDDWMAVLRLAQDRLQRQQAAHPTAAVVPAAGAQLSQPVESPLPGAAEAPPQTPAPAAVDALVDFLVAAPVAAPVAVAAPRGDLPAVMPVPWWWSWQGQGTVQENRHHLKRYILHRLPSETPAAPWSWPRATQTQRALMLLLLMAETGQVLLRALQVGMVRIAQVQDPWKNSGHLQRDAGILVACGAAEARSVEVVTGNNPTTVKLLRLTELGRQWLADLGQTPVEDDWSRLERLHGGENQQTHNYSVLYSTSTLRLWGWEVQVVPTVDPPAQPDLQAQHGAEAPWPGEVERGAGSVDRRHTKWRHIAELNAAQPRLLLVASNPRRLLGLLQEIRTVAPQMEILAGHLGALYLPRSRNQAERPPLVHIQPDDPLAADHLVAAPLAPPALQEATP